MTEQPTQSSSPIICRASLHWMVFYPTLQLLIWMFVFLGGAIYFDAFGYLDSHFEILWWWKALFFLAVFSFIGLSLAKQAVVYLTTSIYMTHHKLFLKTGWLTIQQMELPLRQIESVSVNQDIWGKFFNYGDLTFYGTGGRQPRAFWIVGPSEFSARLNELQDAQNSKD